MSYNSQKDKIIYTFKCTKIGELQISSIYMETIETEVITDLDEIDPQNSQVKTSKTVVQVDDVFEPEIQMRDKYNNNIEMNNNDPKLKL